MIMSSALGDLRIGSSLTSRPGRVLRIKMIQPPINADKRGLKTISLIAFIRIDLRQIRVFQFFSGLLELIL